MAVKKKRLTQRDKLLRARCKKELQEQGILPPDKPKLNRKKFATEVITEVEETEGSLYNYVMGGIAWMTPSKNPIRPVTPEEVGALKVLKIALETKKFEEALPKGTTQYNLQDFYEKVIRPIIDL